MPVTGEITPSQFKSFIDAVFSENPLRRETALKTFDINVTNECGKSALIIACKLRDEAVVQFLVKNGADVNHKDHDGATPLYVSITTLPHNIRIINYLIDNKADINCPACKGATPLMAASAHPGLVDVFRLLLEHKAEVNKSCDQGCTPLFCAIEKGLVENVEELIKRGADVNAVTVRNETPLYKVIDDIREGKYNNQRFTIIEVLLKAGANPDIQSDVKESPLYRLLFCELSTPVLRKIIKLFLRYNVDLTQYNTIEQYTVLSIVCKNDKYELAELLLKNGANPNQLITSTNKAVLSFAPTFRIAELLIKYNAQVNAHDVDKVTALHMAVYRKLASVAGLLLEKGAKPDFAMPNGGTALHIACEQKDLYMVKLLFSYGAGVNAQANDGETPLFIAAQEGCNEIIEFLLKNNANPGLKRKDGLAPLAIAYKEGHKSTVKLFLDNYYKDILGETGEATYEVVYELLLPNADKVTVFVPHFIFPTQQNEALNKPNDQPIQSRSNLTTTTHSQQENYNFSCQSEANGHSSNGQSGIGFLLDRGFSKEDIKRMRVRKPDDINVPGENSQEVIIPTWFNGALKACTEGILKVETTFGSPNCYFYLDEQALTEQKCPNIDRLVKQRSKFCSAQNNQGIKPLLKSVFQFRVIVNGKERIVSATDELKIVSITERVLCFRELSDDGSCTLIIGCLYLPNGLHSSDIKSQKRSIPCVEIHLPSLVQDTFETSKPSLIHGV